MKASFKDKINGEKPVLVDFTATWCGPCKSMAPVLEDLKSTMGDKISIIKIDVDKNPEAARAYGIQSVPTFMIYKKGKMHWRQSGAIPGHVLSQKLKEVL